MQTAENKLDYKELHRLIGYEFKNKDLLTTALTHSSFANEAKGGIKYNERLEFLGDSVLGIVVSNYIYLHCPDLPEGKLTKLRASLVCEKSLYVYAKQIELGKHIRLSKGEKRSGGDDRPSILSDAFEALIAAIYLDGGIEPARNAPSADEKPIRLAITTISRQRAAETMSISSSLSNPEILFRMEGIRYTPIRIHTTRYMTMMRICWASAGPEAFCPTDIVESTASMNIPATSSNTRAPRTICANCSLIRLYSS